ncbi:Uncharacterized protein SCF082_LOCUS24066, partial [Durusdinium trenchii]
SMTTKAMIDAMGTKGYWTSPGGKTPAQTLYSALLREIQNKGKDARIVKVTAAVQQAINDGYRSRAIDADDLVEVLLAIADRLDPPVPETTNEVAFPCPECGESDVDRLIWQDDEFVRCDS